MTGAGVSVSAGIPDFRTPETGIYDRIERILGKTLPTPESLFDVKYFIKHPEVYYTYRQVRFNDLDHRITPEPTLTHHFIKLLLDK
jgi:NAD-dependent SIR2 family protein deacetylase